MTDKHLLVLFFLLFELAVGISIHKRSVQPEERIDCFPEAASPFSGYSKDACLARNCLYEEWPSAGVPQCYMSPEYGYILKQDPQETENGIRLRLQRNQAVGSMFPAAIENVILDVQYYTNDILRFKLYDEDNERYEVEFKRITPNDISLCLSGTYSINSFTRSSIIASIRIQSPVEFFARQSSFVCSETSIRSSHIVRYIAWWSRAQ